MIVTLVSQCEKKALKRTRRVLDAFADRIGDNTWQTIITEDGLLTVKKMLRQTASKSTAVSCHWIRSRSRSQFLWVVGNRLKFNSVGVVAVNYTKLNLDHKDWENGWALHESIMLASSIAGLFHDFGKANNLFQQKLNGTSQSKSEPYRHEWVSLRLFEAFVKELTDKQWLTKLLEINQSNNAQIIEKQVQQTLVKDNGKHTNPFKSLHQDASFAKLVAWLIVSHHRLPLPNTKQSNVNLAGDRDWLSHQFNCDWNSRNAENYTEIAQSVIDANWSFSLGTPFISTKWQNKASELAERALSYHKLNDKVDWLGQRFISHLSRLSLMLSDHYYSSLKLEESKTKWQDEHYKASANTDRKSNQLKQKLDEHNIGVAHNAFLFAKNLPALKQTLPAIAQHRLFTQNVKQAKYQWQDKAFRAAKEVAKNTEKQGFFGINMASTGCGKTMANARIMYALSDEREGCRFSVALGLRTLTLQTGDAYRDLLKLGDDELAVLIGSNAIKLLDQLNQEEATKTKPDHGSESADDLFKQLFVSYAGQIYDGRLKHWLSGSPKLEQLLSAPVLVSTIDHLMPATESKRGGKQIAPMLRLLTSDLILDEPDDFGLEDLPALCRLVNWAGMLGSRVLLSSATLPPALISALYDSYVAGRKHFNQANFPHDKNKGVVCAWFDENKSTAETITDKNAFKIINEKFVAKRLKKLTENTTILRKGKVVNIDTDKIDELPSGDLPTLLNNNPHQKIYQSAAELIHQQIYILHSDHHVTHSSGKKVSIGVVRMANINPMVAVSKLLLAMPAPDNYQFHFCIYHSQFPLALRSQKESRLDQTLTRYDENQLWLQPEISNAVNNSTTQNHVFIVLGTSVVEVGRDHDYDWAIAEPSSLRSIIQLAGRIQRHRQQPPESANLAVLSHNIRALKGEAVAYCKPGFETPKLPLSSKDLNQLLTTELDNISAIPRIVEPKEISAKDFDKEEPHKKNAGATSVNSFAIQEHRSLRITLDVMGGDINHDRFYNSGKPASLWWNEVPAIDWSAEFIKQTEFRQSQPQEEFILRLPEDENLVWSQIDDTRYPPKYINQEHRFSYDKLTELATGNHWWFKQTTEEIYQDFSERLIVSSQTVSEKFGVIGLRKQDDVENNKWHWHQQLGVYEIK